MKVSTAAFVAGLVMATSVPALARDRARHLHVDVQEDQGDRVSVTVPFGVARAAIGAFGTSHVELDGDTDVEQMRDLWDELKASGEGPLVTVDSGDEKIRVTRDGGDVQIDVRENDGSRVRVRMPEKAIDALLSGTGDELDLGAALKALQSSYKGDLVNVEDSGDRVRIWID